MTVRCYHGWHLGFSAGLGVPLLLLVAVAIPFLPIFLLFKYNTQLKETSVKIRLGFLYHSYRCDRGSVFGGDLHAVIKVMLGQVCDEHNACVLLVAEVSDANGSLSAICVAEGLG